MKLTFDPAANIAYLRVREPATDVESVRIGDEIVIDIGPDGKLYGMEFLNAVEQLSEDGGRFLIDAGAGRVASVDVAAE